jgi:hypothetical protein
MPDYFYKIEEDKYYYNNKEISKKEFFIVSKYKLSDFNKLKNSVYPTQLNNYILLKFPSWYPNDIDDNTILKGKYIPCDYKLANFVKFLWKYKINIMGWDQGWCQGRDKVNGFINFTNNISDILDILFGKDKIIILFYLLMKL